MKVRSGKVSKVVWTSRITQRPAKFQLTGYPTPITVCATIVPCPGWKCRGSKTPRPGDPSPSHKDVGGQYAWVVAPAGTTDRYSLQSVVQNRVSNDLPYFHPLKHSNRQLFTRIRLTGYLYNASWNRINRTSPDGASTLTPGGSMINKRR